MTAAPLVPSCKCTAPVMLRAGKVVCATCGAAVHAGVAPELATQPAWIPAAASPLGKRKTLALARAGTIESSKVGRRVLVKRDALDRYIADH